MELILAVLVAGPMGYFARTRKRGLTMYLVAWAIVFPIQTVVVYTEGGGDGRDILYWVFNALILAGGIGLNRLGWNLRRRRGTIRVTS